MLTPRENLMRVMKGERPEYISNQHAYFTSTLDPISLDTAGMCPPGGTIVNGWGVTIGWPEGNPGQYPMDTPETRVIQDITCWRDEIIVPDPYKYTDEDWDECIARARAIDRTEKFCAANSFAGIFERVHAMMGMEEAMISFLTEPEAMHELIDFIADWDIECAKIVIDKIHPDCLFYGDDFGTQISTMISPETFKEFFVPAYKKLYGFWKENGVELIAHHNDAYSATLVPYFIEMGIDIWQGPVLENNIPKLIETYGGQITFQGGIDNGKFDMEGWSYEKIRDHVRNLVDECGVNYFIPSFTAAGPATTYPGAYDAATRAINEVSLEVLGAASPDYGAAATSQSPIA